MLKLWLEVWKIFYHRYNTGLKVNCVTEKPFKEVFAYSIL